MAGFSGRCIAFVLGVAAAAGVAAGCRAHPQNPKGGGKMSAETAPVRLEPGRPLTRDLAGGGTQAFLVGVKAGQYVRVAADQRGIDVALRLLAPDGRLLIEVDSP